MYIAVHNFYFVYLISRLLGDLFADEVFLPQLSDESGLYLSIYMCIYGI